MDRISNGKKELWLFFFLPLLFSISFFFPFEALCLDFILHEFLQIWELILKISNFFYFLKKYWYIFTFFCTFFTLFVKYSPFWHFLFFCAPPSMSNLNYQSKVVFESLNSGGLGSISLYMLPMSGWICRASVSCC